MIIYKRELLINAFKEAEQLLKSNGRIVLEYEPIVRWKTKKQLGHIFKNLVGFLKKELEENGTKCTLETVKLGLYDRVGVIDKDINPFTGKPLYIRRTLSKMGVAECCEFIEKVVDYIDNETFLTLPPATRYTWLFSATDDEFLEANKYCSQAKDKQPEYLAWIRKQHCISCGVHGSEAHHMRLHGGTGIKSPDCYTMPLCNTCHMQLHRDGEQTTYDALRGFLGKRTMQEFCEMNFKKWSMKK